MSKQQLEFHHYRWAGRPRRPGVNHPRTSRQCTGTHPSSWERDRCELCRFRGATIEPGEVFARNATRAFSEARWERKLRNEARAQDRYVTRHAELNWCPMKHPLLDYTGPAWPGDAYWSPIGACVRAQYVRTGRKERLRHAKKFLNTHPDSAGILREVPVILRGRGSAAWFDAVDVGPRLDDLAELITGTVMNRDGFEYREDAAMNHWRYASTGGATVRPMFHLRAAVAELPHGVEAAVRNAADVFGRRGQSQEDAERLTLHMTRALLAVVVADNLSELAFMYLTDGWRNAPPVERIRKEKNYRKLPRPKVGEFWPSERGWENY